MSAVNWTTVKNAIFTWVQESSGLAADRIVWGGQNAIRPPGVADAWISLWIQGDEGTDQGSVRYIDNPTPTPGHELIKLVESQAIVTLQITCFGPQDATDYTEAYVYMSNIRAELQLSEIADPLYEAGVGQIDMSPTVTVPGILNSTLIEPRAQATFQFLTPTVVSRTCTFIETVNASLETKVALDGPVKIYDYEFDLAD